MVWFVGLLAVLAILIGGLVFPANITGTVLVFGPFVILGAVVLFMHFRKNPVTTQTEGESVFTDEDHEPRRAA